MTAGVCRASVSGVQVRACACVCWHTLRPLSRSQMLAMGLRIEDARLVRDLAPWQLKTLHEAVIDGNEGQGQEQRGQGGGGGTTMLAEIVAGRKRLHGALASIAKAEG